MTLHADALALLRDWAPPTPRQRHHRDRFVQHLEAHPDGHRRDCFPAHLTAGTLVLSHDRTSVLLNHHRKADGWFAFGGHCEPGDRSLAGTALREAIEESGVTDLAFDPVPVDLDEHLVGFCDPRGTVHHLDVRFTALAGPGTVPAASGESFDVRWWPVDDLPGGIHEDMRTLITAARVRWAQSTSEPGGDSTWAAADQPSR